MKILNITTPVRVCSFEELTQADRDLVERAKAATRRSYAPYSKFHVGASILMADGTIIDGSNQENAAYPSGLCAERTAAFYASSARPGVAMKKIAIAAWTRLHSEASAPWEDCFQDSPISPCGACRQVLLEYEALHGPIEVILYGSRDIYILPSIASLLPLSFTEF